MRIFIAALLAVFLVASAAIAADRPVGPETGALGGNNDFDKVRNFDWDEYDSKYGMTGSETGFLWGWRETESLGWCIETGGGRPYREGAGCKPQSIPKRLAAPSGEAFSSPTVCD